MASTLWFKTVLHGWYHIMHTALFSNSQVLGYTLRVNQLENKKFTLPLKRAEHGIALSACDPHMYRKAKVEYIHANYINFTFHLF